MDRSNTPKASSQAHQSRRQKNRSRSGSAELAQIIEQGAKYKYGVLSPSMSTSSSSSGISSPVTPVSERGNSPGVLGWVRNALLLGGSNGRNTPPVQITSPSAITAAAAAASAKTSSVGASLLSLDTPLMPGTVRSFHTRAIDSKEEEENIRQQKEMINSVRSSFSLEAPFAWNPFDRNQRRGSLVSNTTTAEDDSSSTSSDEDVYAPFSSNEGNSTAKKDLMESDGSGGNKAQEETNTGSKTDLDISKGLLRDAAMSKLGLDQAQELEELVQDTSTAQPMPNLVLTPPDSSPRQVGSPISSISGWTEPQERTIGFQRPLLERRQSDNKTPVPRDNRSILVAKSTGSGMSLQPHSEGPINESMEGDGEDLEDVMGRARSPQELAKHRPSKESVVLGSRGASDRGGVAERDLKLTIRQVEGIEQEYTNDGQLLSPLPGTSIKGAATFPRSEQLKELNGVTLTAAPQPRRAMNFFTRRREASLAEKSEAEIKDNTKKEANNSNQSTFWKLGKKQSNLSTLNAIEGDIKRNNKQIEELALQHSTSRKSMESGRETTCKYFPRVSTTDSTNSSVGKESKSKRKVGPGLGLLGSSMQPRAVRVRRIKKTQKDRDFARIYLAQELFLDSTIHSTLEDVSAVKASATSASPCKPALPHVDSSTSVASSLASSNATFASSTVQPKKKATWAMKFSLDGKHLAVAGQDAIIRIYAVLDTESARKKVEKEAANPSETFLDTLHYHQCAADSVTSLGKPSAIRKSIPEKPSSSTLPNLAIFQPSPIREFKGHTSDILDLSWSKGGFLLSASMDKTARVWHLSWPNCLVSFAHGDFVTSAVFHPRDDRFFLSGSLDGKLRLWNISAKKVQSSQEVPGLITACAFTESGNMACVGTFAGHALFYHTEGLIYSSSIAVRSPSGKHAKGGRKITSIDPLLPNKEAATNSMGRKTGERILITSNDSRIRAYDLKSKSMIARFKAKTYTNRTSQIKAHVSDDNVFIVAGSEATCGDGGQVYIWNSAAHLFDTNKKLLSKVKLTGNGSTKALPSSLSTDFNVEYFAAHVSTVTCAIMAPLSTNVLLKASQDYILHKSESKVNGSNGGEGAAKRYNRIIVSVDGMAVVRVWRSDTYGTVG